MARTFADLPTRDSWCAKSDANSAEQASAIGGELRHVPKPPSHNRRVALIGAGFISQVHAQALSSLPNITLHAVCDPRESAAQALATKWGASRVFASADETIRSGEVDCVHVLTPPDLHAATALPFLEAGIPALVEKPLAVDQSECEALETAAKRTNTVLSVNHNFVHYPAFERLRRMIEEGRLGQLNIVNCTYNVPLRQITNRQFGHWMFEKPVNILLEQAVHPLSQIIVLAGHIKRLGSTHIARLENFSSTLLPTRVNLSLECSKVPAILSWAVGQNFPYWQVTAVCDDGVAIADIAHNRFFTYRRTRWVEPCDYFLSGLATASGIAQDSCLNAGRYAASLLRLSARNDPFFTSMKASIAAFHRALDNEILPELNAGLGTQVVGICEQAGAAVRIGASKRRLVPAVGKFDILVLGGTGFIGKYVVERLLADGYRVGVMARNLRNLSEPFDDPRVYLMRGDVRSRADVDRAVAGARIVVNLAHGGGGGSYSEVKTAMVDSAELVARVCLEHQVERLIHVGSIAALYLGPTPLPVTGMTGPDPQARHRSDYARAKAECDQLLLKLYALERLPICILRPGVVVGEGGSANHGALGTFNNEQHCIGWNSGLNPLPFVLVNDVADAVALACTNPRAIGRCYNLVGDVRLSAREYIGALADALGRPLRYHPKNPTVLWLQEAGKWLVKAVGGRRTPFPTRRDLLSRGLWAGFDCSDAKTDLGWHPVGDRRFFLERAVNVHRRQA